MSNLDKLIEWMEAEKSTLQSEYSSTHIVLTKVIEVAKQLQKEEPKTYTQEQYDAHGKEMYVKGIENYGLAQVGVKNNLPETV